MHYCITVYVQLDKIYGTDISFKLIDPTKHEIYRKLLQTFYVHGDKTIWYLCGGKAFDILSIYQSENIDLFGGGSKIPLEGFYSDVDEDLDDICTIVWNADRESLGLSVENVLYFLDNLLAHGLIGDVQYNTLKEATMEFKYIKCLSNIRKYVRGEYNGNSN